MTTAIPTQQRLLGIEIEKLKSLSEVSVDFGGSALTAVMGTNCCGKTTVLHALACSYSPAPGSGGPGYKFPQFFKPNSDSLWQGSRFDVLTSQRVGAHVQEVRTEFAKAQDRWTPRYEKRPIRNVRMLMIKDSVPEVETFGLNSMVHYLKTAKTTAVDVEVRDVAGQVLNKNYSHFHSVSYLHGNKKSIGVSSEGLTYPALSMSSGEQRVFHILMMVFAAPKHSLLLIDEIDLFLHQDALDRLLGKLDEHCRAKDKQLVFTTHFPPVAKMYRNISVKTLHRSAGKTIVFDGYSHAALKGITGVQEKPVSVFVEDDVTEAIVECVARDLRMRPWVEVGRFGAAANAFGLAVGVFLSGRPLADMLVVLDGDELSPKAERAERVKGVLTGTEEHRKRERVAVGRSIKPLRAERDGSGCLMSPERMLHSLLHGLSPEGLRQEEADLLAFAKEVVNFTDRHGLIGKIIEATGDRRSVALSALVRLASRSDRWTRYVWFIRKWLLSRKRAHGL